MTDHDDAVLLCCFLWANAGHEAGLTDYETRVLALVSDVAGEVVQRVMSDGSDGHPHEVHILRFPSKRAFDEYLDDPRRAALADDRARVVARTELFPVAFP